MPSIVKCAFTSGESGPAASSYRPSSISSLHTDVLFGLFGVVDESVSGIVQQVERQTEDLRRIAETADRANECVDGVAEQIEAAAELVL